MRWQPSDTNFERSSRKTAITESTRPFTVKRTARRAVSAGLNEYQTGHHASPQSSGSSPHVAPSVVPVSFAGSEMRVAFSVSSFAGVTSSATRVVARPCPASPPYVASRSCSPRLMFAGVYETVHFDENAPLGSRSHVASGSKVPVESFSSVYVTVPDGGWRVAAEPVSVTVATQVAALPGERLPGAQFTETLAVFAAAAGPGSTMNTPATAAATTVPSQSPRHPQRHGSISSTSRFARSMGRSSATCLAAIRILVPLFRHSVMCVNVGGKESPRSTSEASVAF